MDTITIRPTTVIGSASSFDSSELIFDALQVQECQLVFPKLNDVVFFLQGVQLPSIAVNQVVQRTRYVDPNQIGEKINFQPFSINFIVDKNFKNWSSIYNWMKRMTANGSSVGEVDDPVLVVGGKRTIQFIGAWPTQLGGIEFSNTLEEAKYVKTSLTINYDYVDYIGQYKTVDSSYI